MLAKAWRKNPQNQEGIYLYKSGSKGYANSGLEPYSEFYASQIAKKMGLNITTYTLGRWKKNLNSICKLFSSKEFSFVPNCHLVTSGGWEAVFKFYKQLGSSFYDDLIDMLIFDTIIINTDRHFGNFGFLVDNQTNIIVKTAPIFDNGLSLFQDALDDDLEDVEKYANTKIMKNAGGFLSFAQKIIINTTQHKVAKLINFRFTKDKNYNLSAKRLKIIEKFIAIRVEQILQMKSIK
jgi:hypothetical protein